MHIILGKWILIRIRIKVHADQSEKQDLDPNLHQCEKVEAFEDHFGALGLNLEKRTGRIQIHINGEARSQIRINVIRICNTAL